MNVFVRFKVFARSSAEGRRWDRGSIWIGAFVAVGHRRRCACLHRPPRTAISPLNPIVFSTGSLHAGLDARLEFGELDFWIERFFSGGIGRSFRFSFQGEVSRDWWRRRRRGHSLAFYAREGGRGGGHSLAFCAHGMRLSFAVAIHYSRYIIPNVIVSGWLSYWRACQKRKSWAFVSKELSLYLYLSSYHRLGFRGTQLTTSKI